MPSRNDLAKIHIAKKELKLDDATYRGVLWDRYHVDSAAVGRRGTLFICRFWISNQLIFRHPEKEMESLLFSSE